MQHVGDGDSVDLGGLTLEFINAPFLHWPDTMFTYVPQERVLFTCDFLGAHYCEPQVIDSRIVHPQEYRFELENYYRGIMGQFGSFALAGLQKMDELDMDIAAPSHGPVLTKDGILDGVKDAYRQWASAPTRAGKLIPIFYVETYHDTEKLSEGVAMGIRDALPDAEVKRYNIIDNDMTAMARLLNTCDAFCIGSPTLNHDAPTPIWDLLGRAGQLLVARKPALLFGCYGWSGEALGNIQSRLECLKVNVFDDMLKVRFVPTAGDVRAARELGKRFAASLD
jgi:flavorubredoxin